MAKLDVLRPPELPELPFPRADEVEERIETVVNKAVAVPVAKIVSKVVLTPLMIVEKVADGLMEATKQEKGGADGGIGGEKVENGNEKEKF